VDVGEVIALLGASVPVATITARQVSMHYTKAVSKMLTDHMKSDDDRFAKGGDQFKRIDETMGLLLFLQATQSQHNEEIIRVAAPEQYKRHVEPRLKKFGRNGNGD